MQIVIGPHGAIVADRDKVRGRTVRFKTFTLFGGPEYGIWRFHVRHGVLCSSVAAEEYALK